jgi:hypothetical protein
MLDRNQKQLRKTLDKADKEDGHAKKNLHGRMEILPRSERARSTNRPGRYGSS